MLELVRRDDNKFIEQNLSLGVVVQNPSELHEDRSLIETLLYKFPC